ncbi:TPA: replicative DNA helicase [Pseudomonas aeruginosa]|uniref:replicative DNA helicase n=2 Tax=Pseudomonas aeruginosa TaxID=287 RepID=UPI00044AC7F0|nr:replicative DNA helicase [Pseudomonas aeruginosa]AOT38811.1 helicase DnaB [Pseudomonas aeruginosa]AXC19976.1 replicative DNA helicase [Pseudomonas aeruginosa]AYW61801.1 replicative DNA helicase [Pseudomonas aeruginosa]EIU7146628.1 replicative DNA helicase [Pseudomonas aeruginosa]EKB8027575.1 replicative DNA helicase [Pseudomonas aeruginosa]
MTGYLEMQDVPVMGYEVPESKLYSHEAEYAVIGAMIQRGDLIEDMGAKLEVSDFHHPACAELFELLLACQAKGIAVDIVTLYEARAQLADGQSTLQVAAHLVKNTPSAANADEYARIIKQRSVARRVIAAAEVMSQRLQDGEPLDEVLSQGQQAWVALEAEGLDSRRRYRFIGEVLPEAIDGIDRRFNREVKLGYDTGLPSLDAFIPGICPGHMVVVAGEPGSGKTTLGLGFAERVALACNEPALVFSLEMTDVELANRVLSSVGSVPLKHIAEGHSMADSDWPGLTGAVNKLNHAPLILCDDASLTLRDIRQICRTVKREHGLGMVAVDYIGLIKGEQRNASRYDVVTEISKGLKRLAKELGVPVVVLAQLNRGPKARGNKRPTKSDLRDSGQIEADADVVVLVHRDQESDAGKAGITELIVDKNRHGQVGVAHVQHQGQYHRFVEIIGGYQPSEEEVEMARPYKGRQYGKGKTA